MFCFTKFSQSTLFKTTAFNLIVMFITFVMPVYSQDTGAQLLRNGIKLYEAGELDAAIAKLSSCVERADLNTAQKTEAYKYLAQAYMAREFEDQAKGAVEKLLIIMPNYKPDPVEDRPQYIKLVETVIQEQKLKKEEAKDKKKDEKVSPESTKQKSNTKKWLLLGGGVVVAGVVAVVLLGGSEEKEEKGSIKISW